MEVFSHAKESSFDIVSKVELPEVQNEIQTGSQGNQTHAMISKGQKDASHSEGDELVLRIRRRI